MTYSGDLYVEYQRNIVRVEGEEQGNATYNPTATYKLFQGGIWDNLVKCPKEETINEHLRNKELGLVQYMKLSRVK